MLQRPVQPDLFAEYEALQCWRYALQLYNGIEIAFKHLCMLADPALDPKEGLRHDLTKALDEMPLQDRDHINEHFAQYLSLLPDGYRLSGKEIADAREFISHVSDVHPGIGSIQWRYMPLEGMDGLPQLDLWAMLEIWQGASCRIIQRHESSLDGCGSSPGQQITMRLARLMPPDVHPLSVTADDLNEWIDSMHRGSSLAAYVDLLAKGHRRAWHEVHAPTALISVLQRSAEAALARMAREPNGSLLRLLMHAIEDSGGWLRWDATTTGGRFVRETPLDAASGKGDAEDMRSSVSDMRQQDAMRVAGHPVILLDAD